MAGCSAEARGFGGPTAARPANGNGADTLLDGPLAHPVEQGTFNPKVARSRLARPTNHTLRTRTWRAEMDGTQPSAVSQQTMDRVIRCEANVTLPGWTASRYQQSGLFEQRHPYGLAGHGQRHPQ